MLKKLLLNFSNKITDDKNSLRKMLLLWPDERNSICFWLKKINKNPHFEFQLDRGKI